MIVAKLCRARCPDDVSLECGRIVGHAGRCQAPSGEDWPGALPEEVSINIPADSARGAAIRLANQEVTRALFALKDASESREAWLGVLDAEAELTHLLPRGDWQWQLAVIGAVRAAMKAGCFTIALEHLEEYYEFLKGR
ncbi:MAG TPA: hypothetical protein VGB13_04650 [Candidatus Krumholzibacteria bacterium]